MDCLSSLIKIAQQFCKDLPDITAKTTFTQMHMNSYEVVDFVMCVEEELNVVIGDDEILGFECIQDVYESIMKNS